MRERTGLALTGAAGALLGLLGGRAAGSRLAGSQLQKGFALVSALGLAGSVVR